MNFIYSEKTYMSKTTLEDLEYIIGVINQKNYSGILSKAILTSYQSRKKAGFSKSTLSNKLSNLEKLGVLVQTSKGGKIQKGDKTIYSCSKYSINKRKLVELYVLCTFLNQCSKDHSITCKFSRKKVSLSYDTINDILSKTLSDIPNVDDISLSKISNAVVDLKNGQHTVNEIYLYFFKYYFLFLYKELTIDLESNISNSNFLNYLSPFIRDDYYNLASNNELGYLWDNYIEALNSNKSNIEDASLFDISRVNPLSILEPMDASPNITFHLYLTLPNSLPLCCYTDVRENKTNEYNLANLYTRDAPIYNSDIDIIKKLKRKVNFETLQPIKIYTKGKLSAKEESNLRKDYALILANYSSVLSSIAKSLLELGDNPRGFKLDLKVNLDKSKEKTSRGWRYTLSISGRHYNDMAGTPSKFRKQIMEKELKYFDLHSASFNICKILNGLPFNAKDDIKVDMEELNYLDVNGHPIDRNGIKDSHILYRCCFSKSKKDAINKYRRATDVIKQQKRYVDDETFGALYDYCQEWCGGSEKHIHQMFFVESLFELTIFLKIKSKSEWTIYENVYDCFYFDTDVISKEEVEEIANESTLVLKNIIDGEKYAKDNMKQPIKLY